MAAFYWILFSLSALVIAIALFLYIKLRTKKRSADYQETESIEESYYYAAPEHIPEGEVVHFQEIAEKEIAQELLADISHRSIDNNPTRIPWYGSTHYPQNNL